MEFELRRAREKLEREQREFKQKAKLKLEKEKTARQDAQRKNEEIQAALNNRRLAALEAEAKANQELEQDSSAGHGVIFRQILQAVPFQASGDKIKLPPSCFAKLFEQGAFEKGPLHFSLSFAGKDDLSSKDSGENQGNRTTHAGVMEFTSDEGCVGVPPHVWNNLFAPPGNHQLSPMVLVRYVWLPKGAYAKLQAREFGFFDIPNHKAVLETSLRHNATLTQGDWLKVNHGALTYSLRVLELKPSSSVSVLETDIEVDIEIPDSNAEGRNHQTLRTLMFGKPEPGTVEEGNYVYYKFVLDDETWKRISSGSSKLGIKMEEKTGDADSDLYVSRHPNILFPTRQQHVWSSHDAGSKLLTLSSEDKSSLGPGTYSIGIYGFKGKTIYEVSINAEEISKSNKKGKKAVAFSSSIDHDDTVECRNCKHRVPSRTIVLHEAFCSRHHILCQYPGCGVVLRIEEAKSHVHCDKCGKAFHQQADIEKHVKVFHEPLQCPCGAVLEMEEMALHQSSECPMRLISCRFCGDMVQAGNSAPNVRDRVRELSEHESRCGCRTAPCDSCGRAVMLKDMDMHQSAVHDHRESYKQ